MLLESKSDIIDALKENVVGVYPDTRCFIKDDLIYLQFSIAGIDCKTIVVEAGKDAIKVSGKPTETGVMIFDTIRAKPFQRIMKVASGYVIEKALCENGMLSIVLTYPDRNDVVEVEGNPVEVEVKQERQPARRRKRNTK